MNASFDFKAYAVHLEAEHRRLHEAMEDVQELFANRLKDATPELNTREAASQLQRLRNRLTKHFQEEEEGGCIEEAVARCPTLSSEAFDLEHEHVDLMSELDRLITAAEEDEPLTAIDKGYRAFVSRLRNHEAQEIRLIQQGFNVQVE